MDCPFGHPLSEMRYKERQMEKCLSMSMSKRREELQKVGLI